MNLDEIQRGKVAEWIREGLKLSEIQNRIISEFNLKLTYMEVRFLVDDLKLIPKDAERPKPSQTLVASSEAPPPPGQPSATSAPPSGRGVSVSVDQITRAGSLVSGKVVFSDGQPADWYLDQAGRLGLAPQQKGYRPPPGDVPEFQAAIEAELSRLGM